MGGYYYFTIPNNVSDPYDFVTDYDGAYVDRYGGRMQIKNRVPEQQMQKVFSMLTQVIDLNGVSKILSEMITIM